MAYRLSLAAPLTEQLRRVAHDELESAFCELDAPDAEAIHEARKHLKKLRALLELLRPTLARALEEELHSALRRAARALAPARDTVALLECFDRVLKHLPVELATQASPASFAELRVRIAAAADSGEPAVRTARDAINELFELWTAVPAKVGRRELMKGLEDSYARGRKHQKTLRPDDAPEDFHRFRRQVKFHQHHLTLIEGAFRPLLGAQRDEAARLSELLGDHHDLILLGSALSREHGGSSQPEPALELLRADLPRARRELELAALPLSARLYAESPSAFAARVGAYVSLTRASSVP